jgi:EAL domain-containing protein (putative c-di-GMP-specific phosphodiesterase class I)
VDYLKIDRSFVNELVAADVKDPGSNAEDNGGGNAGNDTGSATVISAVIGLARAMGMKVVAEGVETREQLSRLSQMGCEFAQGYHLAPPMPVEAVSAYLKSRTDADNTPGQR